MKIFTAVGKGLDVLATIVLFIVFINVIASGLENRGYWLFALVWLGVRKVKSFEKWRELGDLKRRQEETQDREKWTDDLRRKDASKN